MWSDIKATQAITSTHMTSTTIPIRQLIIKHCWILMSSSHLTHFNISMQIFTKKNYQFARDMPRTFAVTTDATQYIGYCFPKRAHQVRRYVTLKQREHQTNRICSSLPSVYFQNISAHVWQVPYTWILPLNLFILADMDQRVGVGWVNSSHM